MKNLVVFVTPGRKFFGEYAQLVRVWIDNSLDLGWKPRDLLLATNFDYEYNGVRSVVVSDDNYCQPRPRSIKTSIIPYLVDQGIVAEGELHWNHDLEAFQMNQFDGLEDELASVDLGLTDYGWRARWCMGSYWKEQAGEFIERVEKRLLGLTERNNIT